MALSATDVVTPPVRIHFPSLFVKRAVPGATKETYQAVVMIPPDVSLEPFQKAMKEALRAKFGDKFKLSPAKNPIHDAVEKDYDGYEEGWHFINVNANHAPAVVDRQKKPLLDARELLGLDVEAREAKLHEAESRVYAGAWVRFHLNAYAWEHPTGGKGVSFGLKAVQFVRDDEPFSTGASSSADAFDELDDVSTEDSDLFA